jgi:O-methyltransferase involved in polyketide biosynthesis
LDTEEEKGKLLKTAEMMFSYLPPEGQKMLLDWINKEQAPGYRA